MELLEFQDFSVYYKVKRDAYFPALDKLNLSIAQGDFVTVVGPSGCGKTTLLKSILGSCQWTSGRLLFHGMEIGDARLGRENIGYVAQDYNLYPSMTVYENIAHPLRVMHTDLKEIDARVKQIAARLDISPIQTRKPRQISGGQHKRVSIARALIKNPGLLLFDEPFAELEPRLREKLRTLVKQLHEEYRTTIIFVTHDLEEAVELAGKILVLNHGQAEEYGTKEEIMEHPKSELLRGFFMP